MWLRQYSGRANSGHFQSAMVREKISSLREGVLKPVTALPSTITPTGLPAFVITPSALVTDPPRSPAATACLFGW